MDRGTAAVLDAVARGTGAWRSVLCAAARRGKALQADEPEVALVALAGLRSNPLYKGLRVMFDLLELEDLMLDGAPPADVERWLTPAARDWITATMGRVHTDLAADAELAPLASLATVDLLPEPAPSGGWPEPTSAEYLYDLVVLGVFRELRRAASALARD